MFKLLAHPLVGYIKRGVKMYAKVKLAGLDYTTFVNGPGCRTVFFFSSCPHKCVGCHNPETWSINYGKEHDILELAQKTNTFFSNNLISGVTISGGDPFAQPRQMELLVHNLLLNGIDDIWIYTGYTYEEAKTISPYAIEHAKVLVDGKFEKDLADETLKYKGSSNQRIIDLKKTLINKEVTIYNL